MKIESHYNKLNRIREEVKMVIRVVSVIWAILIIGVFFGASNGHLVFASVCVGIMGIWSFLSYYASSLDKFQRYYASFIDEFQNGNINQEEMENKTNQLAENLNLDEVINKI